MSEDTENPHTVAEATVLSPFVGFYYCPVSQALPNVFVSGVP
jgi:hypothetical protein